MSMCPRVRTLLEAVKLAARKCPITVHPKLSVAGNCRMCLIEMGMPMRDRGTGEPVLDDNGVQKDWLDAKANRWLRDERGSGDAH